MANVNERAPLLPNATESDERLLDALSQELHCKLKYRTHQHQFGQGILLVVIFTVSLVLVFALDAKLADFGWSGNLSSNPNIAASQVLSQYPVIVRLLCFN